MILVPVPLEHGVDPLGRDLPNMLLDAGDDFVQGLVQPRVGELVLRDRSHAQRQQRGAGLVGAPGRPALLAARQDHGVNRHSTCAELGKRSPAAELQIVRMCSNRQDGFYFDHGRQVNCQR